MRNKYSRDLGTLSALVAIALLAMTMPLRLVAQDQDDDDPPGRAARLGHMEGSVSFQPAGENEWVEAVSNRPMTTGDKLWADRDSRAEVELGPTTIHLNSNTGFSFINLDDRTVQIQLSSGAITLRVRRLDRDGVMEVDTPNQAFSIFQPGQYRVEASEDGSYTVITVRDGPKLSFIRVMLMARRGTHVRLDQVGAVQAASVTVTTDRPMLAGADGETLPFASPLAPGCPLRIRALPGVLRAIVPARRTPPAPEH